LTQQLQVRARACQLYRRALAPLPAPLAARPTPLSPHQHHFLPVVWVHPADACALPGGERCRPSELQLSGREASSTLHVGPPTVAGAEARRRGLSMRREAPIANPQPLRWFRRTPFLRCDAPVHRPALLPFLSAHALRDERQWASGIRLAPFPLCASRWPVAVWFAPWRLSAIPYVTAPAMIRLSMFFPSMSESYSIWGVRMHIVQVRGSDLLQGSFSRLR
jgi:hypothetical protein